MRFPSWVGPVLSVGAIWLLSGASMPAQQPSFRAGVDVVHFTATVTDGDGHFITDLSREDFVVYDNGTPQEIVSFSKERVPVSLGILIDVSQSMTETRMSFARAAMRRFATDLLGPDDELFLAQFAVRTDMLQTWTQDRTVIGGAMARVTPEFSAIGTAMYDAVSSVILAAATGSHTKKALLILSDGADYGSTMKVKDVQEQIRGTEVLVYALGVDDGATGFGGAGISVDPDALRKLTDETGGRTEVVRGFDRLDEATARIAEELNQQYLIGYEAPSRRDGTWHDIKVEVMKRGAKVRARIGYVAI